MDSVLSFEQQTYELILTNEQKSKRKLALSKLRSLVLTRYNQKKGFYNWAALVSSRKTALKNVLKEFKQVIASYYKKLDTFLLSVKSP